MIGIDNNGPPCQHGLTNMQFPISLDSYDPKTQRAVFDAFSAITIEIPAFNRSIFLFEGYSTKGVKDISASSTAFPHREDNMLLYAPQKKGRKKNTSANFRLYRRLGLP